MNEGFSTAICVLCVLSIWTMLTGFCCKLKSPIKNCYCNVEKYISVPLKLWTHNSLCRRFTPACKISLDQVKFDRNLCQNVLLQILPKVIWRSPMTNICKIYIFGESKMPIWGVTNAIICLYFAPNTPKWLLRVSHDNNLDIWVGQKCKYLPKMLLFFPNGPKSHLGVSHDQNL